MGYAALTFALVQLMSLGVTLHLQRDQSHGGLILHPLLRHFFRLWLWLWFCSGTVTRQWVAPFTAGTSRLRTSPEILTGR